MGPQQMQSAWLSMQPQQQQDPQEQMQQMMASKQMAQQDMQQQQMMPPVSPPSMQGPMLASNFPPAPPKQVQLSNMFKPSPKPKPTPAPQQQAYQGFTPTVIDQLNKFRGQ